MKLIVIGLLCLFTCNSYAQYMQENEKINDTLKVHSPKKAIILSAVLPGAGQVYNHLAMPKGKKNAFWKVPLIYGGLGVSGYFLLTNQKTQLSLKEEYNNRQNNNPLDPKWDLYDDQGVLTLYNQYLDWRDLSILGFSAVYLLQIIDAGIEAHFVNFDISEDLSLSIRPAFLGKNNVGMSLNFNFR